jgi:hypothetical protein
MCFGRKSLHKNFAREETVCKAKQSKKGLTVNLIDKESKHFLFEKHFLLMGPAKGNEHLMISLLLIHCAGVY